jgi:hypothetical protein
VNSKAEVRFKVDEADWLPEEVQKRLLEYQANRINKVFVIFANSKTGRRTDSHKSNFTISISEHERVHGEIARNG